jgi:hypothetical protein
MTYNLVIICNKDLNVSTMMKKLISNRMEIIHNFCERHNLRTIQASWLLAIHFVGLVGLIHAGFNTQYLLKVL